MGVRCATHRIDHGRKTPRDLGEKRYIRESIPLKITRCIALRMLYAAESELSSACERPTTASARRKTNRRVFSRTHDSLRFVLWMVNTNGVREAPQAARTAPKLK